MALAGVKVLDLGRILAAPYATQVLGDMGATVYKVEHPQRGDDTRHWGPPFTAHGDESAYFLAANRNKKSVALDIKSEAGLRVVRALARKCDVMVHNFPPMKVKALGIDYEAMKQVNDGLVYCSLSGYGSSGPYAERLAYDVMVSSIGGLMGITGTPEAPAKVGVAITDVTAGLYMATSICAALVHKGKTGEGQHIQVDLLSTQVASLVNAGSNFLIAGDKGSRHGTKHASIVPYQAFQAQDGHVVIGALNDAQFKRLCKALDAPSIGADARFSTNPLRVKNREVLEQQLAQILAVNSVDHWVSVLNEAQLPAAPVNDLQQVFDDPQVRHLGLVHSLEHPTVGNVKVVGPPVSFGGTPCEIRSAPPTLGQHTDSVLRDELGMTLEQIEQVKSKT